MKLSFFAFKVAELLTVLISDSDTVYRTYIYKTDLQERL